MLGRRQDNAAFRNAMGWAGLVTVAETEGFEPSVP